MPKSAPTDVIPALVGIEETARLLDISRNMAYDLIKTERFPVRVFRVGNLWKVNRSELMAYIAGEQPSGGNESSDD